jgi:hypothetical protein
VFFYLLWLLRVCLRLFVVVLSPAVLLLVLWLEQLMVLVWGVMTVVLDQLTVLVCGFLLLLVLGLMVVVSFGVLDQAGAFLELLVRAHQELEEEAFLEAGLLVELQQDH